MPTVDGLPAPQALPAESEGGRCGSLILLFLVGGIVGTTAGMVRARRAAETEGGGWYEPWEDRFPDVAIATGDGHEKTPSVVIPRRYLTLRYSRSFLSNSS